MITKYNFYKGEIYIPEAKKSITAEVVDNEGDDLSFFIKKYEQEAMLKCFGLLYYEFLSKIDTSQGSLIKVGEDDKWNKLMNGHQYINSKGIEVIWKGLRYDSSDPLNGNNYDTSLLAYYVFYFYKRQFYIKTTRSGDSEQNSKNAENYNLGIKEINAWNTFVKMVQNEDNVKVFNKNGLIGVDYYSGTNEITLYQYIQDMNNLSEDTFQNFNPYSWEKLNQFQF